MRTMSVLMAGNTKVVMFPHGVAFDTNDVFVGSGIIDRILVSNSGTDATQLAIDVYDCLQSDGKPCMGGTSAADSFRLDAGSTTILTDQWGQPYCLGNPGAQLTALRKVVDQLKIGSANQNRPYELPLNVACLGGMAVVLDVAHPAANSGLTITVEYTPWTSGGVRRRRSYRPGSTTKVEPASRNTLPV